MTTARAKQLSMRDMRCVKMLRYTHARKHPLNGSQHVYVIAEHTRTTQQQRRSGRRHALQLLWIRASVYQRSTSNLMWHVARFWVFCSSHLYHYLRASSPSFSLPGRNSNPGSLSRRGSLLDPPRYSACFLFCREEISAILPSSTRIEWRPPMLLIPLIFIFANIF